MRNFKRIVECCEEIVELQENFSLITFWKRRVKMCMIAHLIAKTVYSQRLVVTDANILTSKWNFQRTVELGKEIVELHENLLLIGFWKRRIKMCKEAHLVVMTTHFQSLCSNSWQSLDFYNKLNFQIIVEWAEELHSKLLWITFWMRQFKMRMIAYLVAIIIYF